MNTTNALKIAKLEERLQELRCMMNDAEYTLRTAPGEIERIERIIRELRSAC
jgi:hypothetical protein